MKPWTLAREDKEVAQSLLYLVSRARETCHKMPLLGMELAWTPRDAAKHWNREKAEPMKKTIARLAKAGARTVFHDKSRETVSDGRKKIKLAHGSFDNDVEAVSRMHATILGRKTLPAAIESLAGF